MGNRLKRMESDFSRKATPEEHSVVLENEKHLSKIEILFLFMIVCNFVVDVITFYGVFVLGEQYLMSLSTRYRMTYYVGAVFAPIISAFLLIAFVEKVSQVRKIRNGDFLVQKAMVVNKGTFNKGLLKTEATLMSDEGMLYVANLSAAFAKELPLNTPCLFVRVNQKRSSMFIDEYRCIAFFKR